MGKQKIDPEEAKRLYLVQGMSTIEIARARGMTPSGIKAVLHRVGVQLRGSGGRRTEKTLGFTPTKEWFQEALAAFGNNAKRAAAHYKISYATWIDWMERFGLERNKQGEALRGVPSHRRVEIPLEEAVALSTAGTTYAELAKKYGVSIGVVCRRLKETGHTAPWRRARDERFKNVAYHKRKVLKEINISACEICGETRALDFCHIKPASEGGPTSKENTLVLCQTHHHCYDSGSLTQEEFNKIKPKVRDAEQLYGWTNGFYGGW